MARGLTGVTNGSPKLGRSKAVVRLIQGTQRYMLVMPLARVNSHVLPPVVERRVALNGTTTVALPPAGRTPPRGTVMVWSLRVAFTVAAVDGHPAQHQAAERAHDGVEAEPVDARAGVVAGA